MSFCSQSQFHVSGQLAMQGWGRCTHIASCGRLGTASKLDVSPTGFAGARRFNPVRPDEQGAAVMATGPEPSEPDDFVTVEAAELAERRAGSPAYAPHTPSCRPPRASRRAHARTRRWRVQDRTAVQGASHSALHRESTIRHRTATAEDRALCARAAGVRGRPLRPARTIRRGDRSTAKEEGPARSGGGPRSGVPAR